MSYPKQSGGGKFTDALLQGVSGIPDTRVIEYRISSSVPLVRRIVNCLRGYVQGVTPAMQDEIIAICMRENVNVLFVGCTFFGTLCRNVKRSIPNMRIVSVAQNVEFLYSYQMFRINLEKPLQWLPFQFAIWLNERRQMAASDFVFALNARDAHDLSRLYGRQPDETIGIVLPDKFSDSQPTESPFQTPYALFVGSRFPPNEYAVRWIAKNIAPESPLPVKIVGHGFEGFRDELNGIPNFEIIGTVDDLASYYQHAQFVISPIFHGSGMKVKTTEALMFGKRILGTQEALEGYDIDNAADVIHCQSTEEFLTAMQQSSSCPLFSKPNRDIYLRRHSPAALSEKLQHAITNR